MTSSARISSSPEGSSSTREHYLWFVSKGLLTDLSSQLSWCMGYIADSARKFFHPGAINDMLSTFVPLIDGTNLDVSADPFMNLIVLTHPNRASSPLTFTS
jgi:hypothetical protein